MCACKECVACCYRQPGPLIPGDAERIAKHFGITLDEVKNFLWASPGALARRRNQTVSIKTITPRMVKGRCVFLDAKDRCTIHPVAPFGCAYSDVHQSKNEAMRRSLWGHSLIYSSDEYKRLRATLMLATNYKPRAY
jgi:Fe-S-cluster containining protein